MIKKGYYKGYKIGSKEYWNIQYSSYLNKRSKIQQEGYAMKQVMTKSEFKKVYKQAKELGVKNIIRTMANEDKAISFDVAKKIFKEKTKDIDFAKMDPKERQKFKKQTFKNIIGLDFIDEQIEAEVMDKYVKRYGRAYSAQHFKEYAFFSYMAELGLREEAEEYYGY